MNCMVLLSGIAALAVLHVCQGSGLNVTLTHGSTTIGTGEPFSFTCNASETNDMVNFTVYVVGQPENDILGHLTYDRISKTVMNYTVTAVSASDNKAGLICEGKAGDKSGNSSVVPLNVLFPPTFDEGEGNSLIMFNLSSNYTLNYTVTPGNPNTTLGIKLSSSASSLSNVHNVTNTTLSVFEITNATLANAGGYSAVVNNSFGNTTLTYNVFVGGPLNASLFIISCNQSTNGTLLSISCKVEDKNSAPATLLQFGIPGLGLHYTDNLDFDKIPVSATYSPLFNISLENVAAGNYGLEISASSGISVSVVSIYNQTFYFAGLKNISCTIEPNNSAHQILDVGNNFTFTCAVKGPNGPIMNPAITLVIPGDDGKLGKVTNQTTNTSITFTYSITNYTDDQTVFFCQYSNSGDVWPSPNLTLTVFYGPRYTYSNMSQKVVNNGTDFSVDIGLMSNPPIANYTWTVNGTKLSNSSNVKVMPGELHLMPVLVDSKGTYSVHECNNISCSNLGFVITAVYYPPLFANNLRNYSALTEIATGNNRTLTCTVVQYSGPKNLTLNMTTASDVPSKPRKINDSSISVTITNASTADATQYICTACTGDTLCSYLNFLTYVGGPPNEANLTNIKVSAAESSGDEYTVTFTANFTDFSDVPVTKLKYVINQTNIAKNVSVQAPMKGVNQPVRATETLKHNELGGGSYFNMDFYAVNDLGSLSLTMVKVTVTLGPTTPTPTPTGPSPSKSNAGVIALAVVLPVAFVLFLIAAAVGGYVYYKRHTKQRHKYVPVNADSANIDDASGGHYGSI